MSSRDDENSPFRDCRPGKCDNCGADAPTRPCPGTRAHMCQKCAPYLWPKEEEEAETTPEYRFDSVGYVKEVVTGEQIPKKVLSTLEIIREIQAYHFDKHGGYARAAVRYYRMHCGLAGIPVEPFKVLLEAYVADIEHSSWEKREMMDRKYPEHLSHLQENDESS